MNQPRIRNSALKRRARCSRASAVPAGKFRGLRLPIPSEKNRNVGTIPLFGHTWILRNYLFGGILEGKQDYYSKSKDDFGSLELMVQYMVLNIHSGCV